MAESITHHARRAGALHQNIGLEAFELGKAFEMERAAEFAHDGFLFQAFVMIEHVDVQPALRTDQRGKETDRAGAGNEERLRRPGPRTLPNMIGLIPRLGDDTGWFDQDTVHPERRIELDQKFRLDAEKIRTVAVAFLDAALGVAAIAAHVPFADGAARTGHRIGPPYDADHEIAGLETRT